MSNDVVLEEWEIKGIQVSENSKHYDFEDRDYSQVKVDIHIQRNHGYYLTKMLSILALIIACSWIVFWLGVDDLAGRTNISVTLFLAAITFTFVVGSMLPKISYHTYLDQYLIASYIFIVLSILFNLLIHEVSFSEELNKWCQIMFPISYTIYSLGWYYYSAWVQSKDRKKLLQALTVNNTVNNKKIKTE